MQGDTDLLREVLPGRPETHPHKQFLEAATAPQTTQELRRYFPGGILSLTCYLIVTCVVKYCRSIAALLRPFYLLLSYCVHTS